MNTPHYGNALVFSIIGEQNPLRVDTLPPTGLSADSATLNGHFEPGGLDIQERGFCISSENESPTLENLDMPILSVREGSDSFVITDLTPRTTYHFRAFATNRRGTVYGNVLSFTTLADDNGGVVIDVPGEKL